MFFNAFDSLNQALIKAADSMREFVETYNRIKNKRNIRRFPPGSRRRILCCRKYKYARPSMRHRFEHSQSA
jgi:hypothetical protein